MTTETLIDTVPIDKFKIHGVPGDTVLGDTVGAVWYTASERLQNGAVEVEVHLELSTKASATTFHRTIWVTHVATVSSDRANDRTAKISFTAHYNGCEVKGLINLGDGSGHFKPPFKR